MHQIKIPPTIKIGTHTYQVNYERNLIANENKLGSAAHLKQLILIEPEQAKSEKDATFIHEVIHIIERMYSITINDADVDRLSQGIMELLVNNFGIKFNWENIKEEK